MFCLDFFDRGFGSFWISRRPRGVKLSQLASFKNGRGQHRGLLRADQGSAEEVGSSYRRSRADAGRLDRLRRLTPPQFGTDRNRPNDQPDIVIRANSTVVRYSRPF
jgi:hypothetical protein